MRKFIEWDNRLFNTGHREIDDQHRRLVSILNNLYLSSLENEKNSLSNAFLESLTETKEYVIYHFSMEERIMNALSYHERHDHMKEHRLFEQQMDKLLFGLEATDNPNIRFLSRKFMIFLKSWLLNHIAELDKKFIKECSSIIKIRMDETKRK